MTVRGDIPFLEGAPRCSGFSEGAAVEGPAVELFRALGWGHANLQGSFGGERHAKAAPACARRCCRTACGPRCRN